MSLISNNRIILILEEEEEENRILNMAIEKRQKMIIYL